MARLNSVSLSVQEKTSSQSLFEDSVHGVIAMLMRLQKSSFRSASSMGETSLDLTRNGTFKTSGIGGLHEKCFSANATTGFKFSQGSRLDFFFVYA